MKSLTDSDVGSRMKPYSCVQIVVSMFLFTMRLCSVILYLDFCHFCVELLQGQHEQRGDVHPIHKETV